MEYLGMFACCEELVCEMMPALELKSDPRAEKSKYQQGSLDCQMASTWRNFPPPRAVGHGDLRKRPPNRRHLYLNAAPSDEVIFTTADHHIVKMPLLHAPFYATATT
jgi:hypothetical protein